MVQDNANNQDAREHAEGGTWVAVRDAAAILGVSVDTVKRRMQRGELERRRETIPQGFRWLVRVDPVISEAVGSPVTNETPSQSLAVPSQSPDVVAALLHELEVRNQEVARLHDIVAALSHAVEQRPILPATTSPPADEAIQTPESAGTDAEDPEDFDRDPWLFNVRNGILDLRTGKLRPPDRGNLISKAGILERLRAWLGRSR